MAWVCSVHRFMLQVLFEDLRFKERPFEWVYEGLQPLELPHVLEARVGPSLTLAALWSCVAGACRLSHVIVPVPQGGLAAAVAHVCAGALLQGLRSPAAGSWSAACFALADSSHAMQATSSLSRLKRLCWGDCRRQCRCTSCDSLWTAACCALAEAAT